MGKTCRSPIKESKSDGGLFNNFCSGITFVVVEAFCSGKTG